MMLFHVAFQLVDSSLDLEAAWRMKAIVLTAMVLLAVSCGEVTSYTPFRLLHPSICHRIVQHFPVSITWSFTLWPCYEAECLTVAIQVKFTSILRQKQSSDEPVEWVNRVMNPLWACNNPGRICEEGHVDLHLFLQERHWNVTTVSTKAVGTQWRPAHLPMMFVPESCSYPLCVSLLIPTQSDLCCS